MRGKAAALTTLTAGIMALSHAASASPIALVADADAFVRGGGQSGSSSGLGQILTAADNNSASGDYKTYIRFDLSSVSGTIESASLNLTFDDVLNSTGTPTYSVYGMGDALGDSWIESLISFNTAPGNNTDYQDMTGSTLLGDFTYDRSVVSGGDTFSFASSALDTFLNTGVGADGLATLIIIAPKGQNLRDDWASRENETYDGPGLIFDVASAHDPDPGPDPGRDPNVIPLPASAWLLIGGIAGLGLLRRRQKPLS